MITGKWWLKDSSAIHVVPSVYIREYKWTENQVAILIDIINPQEKSFRINIFNEKKTINNNNNNNSYKLSKDIHARCAKDIPLVSKGICSIGQPMNIFKISNDEEIICDQYIDLSIYNNESNLLCISEILGGFVDDLLHE